MAERIPRPSGHVPIPLGVGRWGPRPQTGSSDQDGVTGDAHDPMEPETNVPVVLGVPCGFSGESLVSE